MRKLLTLVIGSAMIWSSSLLAADGDWKPNDNDIAKLESHMRLADAENPERAVPPEPLAKYDRYYLGVTMSGRRMIQGILIVEPLRAWIRLGKTSNAEVVDRRHFPEVYDGGCGVVNLLYDPLGGRMVWIRCNGLA